MKREAALIIAGILFLTSIVRSQSWTYDFGTATGTIMSGSSTTFLPAPDSMGGIARVRVGYGGGSISLNNPGVFVFGSGSELTLTAPSNESPNKFSIYNYSPGKIFVNKFDIRFSGGSGGSFYFFQGNGSTFSNDTGAAGRDLFTDIAWDITDSGNIRLSYRDINRQWIVDNDTLFKINTNYNVMVIGNNSNSSVKYSYLNSEYTVLSFRWHMWVGNNLILLNKDKDHLSNDSSINSFTFYAEGSKPNSSTLYLDNIEYMNSLDTLAVTGVDNSRTDNLVSFRLSQNYPNPFNPYTTIAYTIPSATHVRLKVFDILGNEIQTLVNGEQNSGSYKVEFNGRNLSSGLYFYKIETGNFIEVKKMLLMK